MRCRLNKNIDMDILLGQLPLLKKYGWKKIKLYLMIGFPWEKEEDIEAIREILIPFEKEHIDINLSVSPFIPKPHTPFQWLPMENEKILSEKIIMLKKSLKGRRVKVKYRDPKTSIIEAIVSRGNDQLSPLFEYLFHKGVKLEAWREYFQPGLYDEWFDQQGISMDDYLTAKPVEGSLPWDMIDTGINKSFLARELVHAEAREKTDDCYTGCAVCGIGCEAPHSGIRIMDYGLKPSIESEIDASQLKIQNSSTLHSSICPATEDGELRTEDSTSSPRPPVPTQTGSTLAPGIKYTFRYGKYADARYIGHLDTMHILLRALRSLGVTIRTHGKYHPMPKISLSDALPMGIESTCELMEIETDIGVLIYEKTIEEMNRILPRGIKIYEFIKGNLQNMVKDYSYLLITDKNIDMRLWKLGYNGKKHFYTWKGKGIKELKAKGDFQRIIKMEDRRIHGLRIDN
jgi:hypothetical protein